MTHRIVAIITVIVNYYVIRIAKPAGKQLQLIQPVEMGDFNADLALGGVFTFSMLAQQVATAVSGDVLSQVVLRYRMADGTAVGNAGSAFTDKSLPVGSLLEREATINLPPCPDVSQPIKSLESIVLWEVAPATTADILHAKLERGSTKTQFIADGPATNVVKCQRDYEVGSEVTIMFPWDSGAQVVRLGVPFKTSKRSDNVKVTLTKQGGAATCDVLSTDSEGFVLRGIGGGSEPTKEYVTVTWVASDEL